MSVKQGLNDVLMCSLNALLSGIDSKADVINSITEYVCNVKKGRKPTRKQKEILQSKRLNPNNWLVIRESMTEIIILSKTVGNVKLVKKAV